MVQLWLGKYWDELLVYIFTVAGVIGYMIYAARLAGLKLHIDLLVLIGAGIASMGLSWLAETRGMKAAKKAGDLDSHRMGRRKNLVIRLFIGFAFGFIGQMVLPDVLDAVEKFVLGSVQSFLGAA